MQLRSMSDDQLEQNLKGYVVRERKLLYWVLEHIREVDRRRLYLDRAYPSLYEYLIKECRYSGAAAMRRLEAARLLGEVPEMAVPLREGSLNLSQIGELARAVKQKERLTGETVTAADKRGLLIKVEGQDLRETQFLLAGALGIPIQKTEVLRVQRDGSVLVEMTFSRRQYESLLRCRDQLSRRPGASVLIATWAGLIESLSREFLAEPVARRPVSSRPVKMDPIHVSKQARADLLREGCCEYVDQKTGRICGSTYGLQIDHRVPRWAGGLSGRENLQVLCAVHNRHRYQRQAGLRLH